MRCHAPRSLLACLVLALPAAAQEEERPAETPKGVVLHEDGAFEGYTLFAPLRGTEVLLMDMSGEVVHRWQTQQRPGNSVYLLADGSLLRCAREDNEVFSGGGQGGRVQRLSWDGEILWDYSFSNDLHLHHHDIEPMPDGNVLLIAWEGLTQEEALALGRDPELVGERGLWPDFVVEVRPDGPTGGEIVWEWHAKDHLIQDVDPKKPNFGVVKDHPERIDINGDRVKEVVSPERQRELEQLGYADGGQDPAPRERGGRDRGGRGPGADWLHTNSIDYHPGLDQIVLSAREFSELWVIDHDTTTEEAAGPAGDLLYRWGNPARYGGAPEEARQLWVQHDVQWIEEGCPGAGNFLVFNNGSGRPPEDYSSVDEIAPPYDDGGGYRLEGDFFQPVTADWSYSAPRRRSMYSGHISGVQRLPNGNTLICVGEPGRFLEVTADGEPVWDFRFAGIQEERRAPEGIPDRGPEGQPRPGGPPPGRGTGRRGGRNRGPGSATAVFRATRLAPDHPGLAHLFAEAEAEG